MGILGRPAVTFAIVVLGALLASAIMVQLSSGSSVLAFIGWTIFFVSLQLPWIWISNSSNCMSWISRVRGK